ncbi:MAG: YgeY family selenium metabolism-linked hydrolase [Chloroflexaceae bacterium]|nr:YgeY family selenium metabolism-linked hydrolase [Chloroflexaceae bacterium]
MLSPSQQQQVIALCQELVQAESLAGREAAAAAVVARWMERLGYDEVWTDRFGSVIGRRRGSGPGSNLHFDGHIDTVPATSLERWTHPPYGGVLAEGRIWGRGSSDMKGPDAAMICAGAFVPRESFCGSITVSASVGEEELEGPALAAILAEHPADMVIIGESSELKIGIGQKGRAGVQVRTSGVPAHSSRPEEGVNAVYRMLEAVNRIRAIPAPPDELLGPGINELVEIVSAPFPGTSIVPDGCRARFDRRLVRGETRASVLHMFREALAGLEGVEVDYLQVTIPCYTGDAIVSDDFHPAWATPRDAVLVHAAEAALRTCGLPVDYFTARYCSNGSASAGELGIPSLILGPSSPALAHIVDEYIEVDQLLKGTEVYMALAAELLRPLR